MSYFYYLCSLQQLVKTYIDTDVNRRRDYVRTVAAGGKSCIYLFLVNILSNWVC